MGSADPPLAVHCLYAHRHRHLRRLGTGEAYRLGELRAAAPARLAPVHRSVLVRAAVCHQVAQQATHRLNLVDVHNDLEERASVFGYVGWQITLRSVSWTRSQHPDRGVLSSRSANGDEKAVELENEKAGPRPARGGEPSDARVGASRRIEGVYIAFTADHVDAIAL